MKRMISLSLMVVCLMTVASFKSQTLAQGKYEIKEMTPAIKSALENRKERFNQLRELKSQGIIGENNRGYVELRNDNEDVKKIVMAENKDRKILYQAIEEQNNLKGSLKTIEEVFAQVQRDKAIPGDKIQNEDGQWLTK